MSSTPKHGKELFTILHPQSTPPPINPTVGVSKASIDTPLSNSAAYFRHHVENYRGYVGGGSIKKNKSKKNKSKKVKSKKSKKQRK